MLLLKLGLGLPNLVKKFQSVLKIWTECTLNFLEVECTTPPPTLNFHEAECPALSLTF